MDVSGWKLEGEAKARQGSRLIRLQICAAGSTYALFSAEGPTFEEATFEATHEIPSTIHPDTYIAVFRRILPIRNTASIMPQANG